ncbi:hypothetical protein FGIG_03466 [Fasciola gigantica]|uniref:Ionotropic glutamate receptor C-terminal domain-containing protein n=1 Tax=Fasciola gigantica TaxID=46835 RepID=A0A504YMG1_FASGI|nr:hypothetical protein FGIG_03466 [Fasciola gigantica]
MSQTLDRSRVGRFIGLIDEDEVGMLMARSTTSGAAFETLGVFRPPVLLILAVCSSVGSILIYLVNWLSPYSSRNQQLSGADMFDSSLPEQCTIMLKACLGQNILFYPRAPSSRMLLMSFWMMAFLLFLGWKVDVAAFLTSNKVVYAINSFEELASSKTYIPLVVSGSGILGFLRDASLNPAYQGLYEEIIARVDSKGTTVNNITDGVKQVLDNPSKVLVGSYAVLKFIQQIQCNELVLAPQRVDQGQRALMTRKEMDWGPTMDKYLRRLKETGVINRIQTKWSNQMHVCSVDTTIFKPLSIAGISALLIMLAASLSLSFSALLIELLWVRFGEHVWSHFLVRIWPNQRRG